MAAIIFEEIKKIFIRPIIQISVIVFILISVFLICFIPGGRSYYYDSDTDRLIEISSPKKIVELKRIYMNNMKGIITDKDIKRYYNDYQTLINDFNNYDNVIDLQKQKDRRFELLGQGYSEEEIDKIENEEPIYELNPDIKYNKLWNYQPIKHLFKLYSNENMDGMDTLKEILSEGTLLDWCGGYTNAIKCANDILSIGIGLLIILGISTVFSEEVQYNIKGIIFTTKYGKGKVIWGKIVSVILYITIIIAIAISIDLFASQMVYKMGNGKVFIQMSEEFMEYNVLISHNSLLWIEWICIFIGGIYLASIVLLISSICNSDFTSIFTSIFVYFISSLVTLLLNTEEHIWKLFIPTTLMHPLQYFQNNYELFGLDISNYIISMLLGSFLMCLFFMLSANIYKQRRSKA